MLAIALSLAALGGLALASPTTTPVDAMHLFKRISSGCGTSGQTSCHNTTKQTNLCCFESPGVSPPSMFLLDDPNAHHDALRRGYCFKPRWVVQTGGGGLPYVYTLPRSSGIPTRRLDRRTVGRYMVSI